LPIRLEDELELFRPRLGSAPLTLLITRFTPDCFCGRPRWSHPPAIPRRWATCRLDAAAARRFVAPERLNRPVVAAPGRLKRAELALLVRRVRIALDI